MSAPSDSNHAPKSQGQMGYSISSLYLEYFSRKIPIFRTFGIELSEQNPTNSVT